MVILPDTCETDGGDASLPTLASAVVAQKPPLKTTDSNSDDSLLKTYDALHSLLQKLDISATTDSKKGTSPHRFTSTKLNERGINENHGISPPGQQYGNQHRLSPPDERDLIVNGLRQELLAISVPDQHTNELTELRSSHVQLPPNVYPPELSAPVAKTNDLYISSSAHQIQNQQTLPYQEQYERYPVFQNQGMHELSSPVSTVNISPLGNHNHDQHDLSALSVGVGYISPTFPFSRTNEDVNQNFGYPGSYSSGPLPAAGFDEGRIIPISNIASELTNGTISQPVIRTRDAMPPVNSSNWCPGSMMPSVSASVIGSRPEFPCHSLSFSVNGPNGTLNSQRPDGQQKISGMQSNAFDSHFKSVFPETSVSESFNTQPISIPELIKIDANGSKRKMNEVPYNASSKQLKGDAAGAVGTSCRLPNSYQRIGCSIVGSKPECPMYTLVDGCSVYPSSHNSPVSPPPLSRCQYASPAPSINPPIKSSIDATIKALLGAPQTARLSTSNPMSTSASISYPTTMQQHLMPPPAYPAPNIKKSTICRSNSHASMQQDVAKFIEQFNKHDDLGYPRLHLIIYKAIEEENAAILKNKLRDILNLASCGKQILQAIINSQTKTSRTALFLCVHLRQLDLVKILLQAGADPNISGSIETTGHEKVSRTPLQLAASMGNKCLPIVQALLACDKIDVDRKSETDSRTALTCAILSHKQLIDESNRIEADQCVMALIQADAVVHSLDVMSGKTSIMFIVESKCPELLKSVINTLLNKESIGATGTRDILNERSRSGDTPLHIAVGLKMPDRDRHVMLLYLLLKNGADVDGKDHEEHTPKFYCQSLINLAMQRWRGATTPMQGRPRLKS